MAIEKTKRAIYRNLIPRLGVFFARRRQIPVIYYHDVVTERRGCSFIRTSFNVFQEQMRYLSNQKYKTYTFEEIPRAFSKRLQSKEVIITFDDGFLSNYKCVFPLMREMGLKFNVFLAVGYIENLSMSKYLTWDMIKEMSSSNCVGFGAHTFSHIDAREVYKDKVCFQKEIVHTNDLIREKTGKEVRDFCFPFGYYNKEALRFLSKYSGYHRLYTSDYRRLTVINGCDIIGRIPISNEYTLKQFSEQLQGYYDIMYFYSCLAKYSSKTGKH